MQSVNFRILMHWICWMAILYVVHIFMYMCSLRMPVRWSMVNHIGHACQSGSPCDCAWLPTSIYLQGGNIIQNYPYGVCVDALITVLINIVCQASWDDTKDSLIQRQSDCLKSTGILCSPTLPCSADADQARNLIQGALSQNSSNLCKQLDDDYRITADCSSSNGLRQNTYLKDDWLVLMMDWWPMASDVALTKLLTPSACLYILITPMTPANF
jgi:hypothetical protein